MSHPVPPLPPPLPSLPAQAAAPRRDAWTADRERGNLWMLRLMGWVALHAGRPFTRCLLPPITLYFVIVHGRARRASFDYLSRALNRSARWGDVFRHVHTFASTVLDRIYFLQERNDQFALTAVNAEAILEPLMRGNGVMLVGAHLGSFEALRADATGRGAKVAMLMFEDNARLINATLAAVAPNARLHTIALGRPGAMLSLRQWLDSGGVAGLLCDRTLPGRSERSRTVRIDFLGRPADFSDGPFRLAALLRREVIFMTGLYRGGNRYELVFAPLADFRPDAAGAAPNDSKKGVGNGVSGGASGGASNSASTSRSSIDDEVAAALKRYVALLETLCRQAPYNWFNFYDFWATDDQADAAAASAE